MNSHEGLPWLRTGAARLGAPTLCMCACRAGDCHRRSVEAKDAVRNLGGGLEQIAAPASRAQATVAAQRTAARKSQNFK